jgi:hypothetical protein
LLEQAKLAPSATANEKPELGQVSARRIALVGLAAKLIEAESSENVATTQDEVYLTSALQCSRELEVSSSLS